MLLPLAKKAGVVSSAVKVLNHPATSAATTALTLAPVVSEMLSKPEPEPRQRGKVGHLLPELKMGILHLAAPIAARVGAFLAKPAVNGAMNAAGAASTVKSLVPSREAPGMRAPTNAQPSDSFAQPMTRLSSVISTETGTTDMAQAVTPMGAVPSTRGTPDARPSTRQVGQPAKSRSSGVTKAFKTAGIGKLFNAPQFDRALNLASQAAVIGSVGIPVYQMYQDDKRAREAMLPRKVAAMLPLQPKRPLMDRIGEGVKDFGDGAYNAIDHEAGKLLTPTTEFDPASHRIPLLSHTI